MTKRRRRNKNKNIKMKINKAESYELEIYKECSQYLRKMCTFHKRCAMMCTILETVMQDDVKDKKMTEIEM